MQIQYRGTGPVVSRDIVGDEYAFWQPGEIKSVAPGQRLRVRIREAGFDGEPITRTEERAAEDVIFAAGPLWVDVASDKNPRFVCAACGETTTAELFVGGSGPVAYQDANGRRLCVADFLRANPAHIEHHQRRGFDAAVLDEQPATRSALVVIASSDAHTGDDVDRDADPDDAE